ncbi:hypothetical protein CONLIGDRAFT_649823 [Coniochaeta ligniaria NRRL 30616]|uniref:Uncharacterized protein n=1 Tax=Coniochaeta ligniaria NRRL 30616 TaxID=1408157 RepID=A0A1J7IQB8_9PEZI|nr:hypothetical protein CONLIGDRAFT_649823 [Coniochaeta ligniaria NRRL 30616]
MKGSQRSNAIGRIKPSTQSSRRTGSMLLSPSTKVSTTLKDPNETHAQVNKADGQAEEGELAHHEKCNEDENSDDTSLPSPDRSSPTPGKTETSQSCSADSSDAPPQHIPRHGCSSREPRYSDDLRRQRACQISGPKFAAPS